MNGFQVRSIAIAEVAGWKQAPNWLGSIVIEP
jgi:hypothetical protein